MMINTFQKSTHKRKKDKLIKLKLQENVECYICGSTQQLHNHHCIFGKGNRAVSDKYGLTLYICLTHHAEIHKNKTLRKEIANYAKGEFIKQYSISEYMRIFEGVYKC